MNKPSVKSFASITPIGFFKSQLKIDYSYQPDLIAGLIIQVGSIMVDTSVKTKLKKLENNLVEA